MKVSPGPLVAGYRWPVETATLSIGTQPPVSSPEPR